MSLASTMIMALSLQIITYFLLITITTSSPRGFTIDLTQRRTNSSSSRPSNNDGSSPYADTVYDSFEYLMKLQIGTPPVEIEAILDTGSDIIWTQCLPCIHCYDQEAPIFDPSKSSTYKDKTNPYEIIYADQSYSKGTLATETVTLHSTSGQPFVMPETTIGCGHNNSVQISTKSSGVIGLNWAALSLISQMGEGFHGLFSYCFSGKGTSKINFGDNAIVAGGTVATDIFRKNDKPNLYYLNLDAISVGENRIETLGTEFHSLDGNIMIDSGTAYTYLPDPYCNQVKDAVDKLVMAQRSAYSGENLCYDTNNIEIFPVITMHFFGGADLVLERRNMFVDATGGSYCLAITCVDSSEDAVVGNIAQNNWLVGYDTYSQLVSFKSTDCSTLWS